MDNLLENKFPGLEKSISSYFSKYPKVDINNLPIYSEWPNLLFKKGGKKVKSKNTIFNEYESEKWGELLGIYHSNQNLSVDNIREIFFGKDLLPAKWLDNYYLISGYEYSKIQSAFLSEILLKYEFKNLVELGGGFGSIMFELSKNSELKMTNYFCGELTPSGCELMKLLNRKENLDLLVFEYDFHSKKDINISIPENSIIYTCFSICEVKGLGDNIIKKIIDLKPKLVINIEASFLDDNKTLLSLLEREYTLYNDYNTTFDSSIQKLNKNGIINLHCNIPRIIGRNPLRPASLYIWSPN